MSDRSSACQKNLPQGSENQRVQGRLPTADAKVSLAQGLVNHNLSKRTKVYALCTKVDNRAQGTYGYRINSNLDAASAG